MATRAKTDTMIILYKTRRTINYFENDLNFFLVDQKSLRGMGNVSNCVKVVDFKSKAEYH
jgi:hypothetical protein